MSWKKDGTEVKSWFLHIQFSFGMNHAYFIGLVKKIMRDNYLSDFQTVQYFLKVGDIMTSCQWTQINIQTKNDKVIDRTWKLYSQVVV